MAQIFQEALGAVQAIKKLVPALDRAEQVLDTASTAESSITRLQALKAQLEKSLGSEEQRLKDSVAELEGKINKASGKLTMLVAQITAGEKDVERAKAAGSQELEARKKLLALEFNTARLGLEDQAKGWRAATKMAQDDHERVIKSLAAEEAQVTARLDRLKGSIRKLQAEIAAAV